MLNHPPIHIVGIGGTLRPRSTSLWALQHALSAAERSGASVDLLPLRDLDLPFLQPGRRLDDYDPHVARFIQRVQAADALLLSTAAYHGTLAGVTKNALDFLEFLRDGEPPYLQGRVVGLIATAAGDMANVHAVDALVHVVHSLRGTVAPLQVAIPRAAEVFDRDGAIQAPKWAQRLEQLGALVAEMAALSARTPVPVYR